MRLKVTDLRFSYSKRTVLDGISFSAEKGELLSVLGANGAGKSTLFRCILGAYQSYSGTIEARGDDIRSLSQREMAKRMAYIPQNHGTAFNYSVLDTVLMGAARQLSPFAVPGPAQYQAARESLKRIGIYHLIDRSFGHLSGGEQQLVMVARALTQQADILIMDEPTASLDYGNQLRIMEQVRQLAAEGYTVLLSTHNPQHALSYSDRILALSHGKIAALGKPQDVLDAKLLRSLYQVEAELTETPGGTVISPRTKKGA